MLAHKNPLHSWTFLLLGAGSAIVALVPWIITGMRLPLQQLWSQQTLPEDMPIALLPFHLYFALTVAALIVIGSTIAGLIGRNVAARHPRAALGALVGGVIGVQVIGTVQTAIVLLSGLEDGGTSMLYLALLVGGTVAAILLGLGMLLLIARGPKPGALLALSIAAVAFTSWMNALFFPIGGYREWGPMSDVLTSATRYVPAVIIGVGIAWCGIKTAGRAVAAIVSLIVLCVGPILVTAVSAAIGTRVLAPYPAEMLDYGLGVFRMAIGMPELWLPPVLLAASIALIGLVGRRSARMRMSAPVSTAAR
jgi:hypothetical protein